MLNDKQKIEILEKEKRLLEDKLEIIDILLGFLKHDGNNSLNVIMMSYQMLELPFIEKMPNTQEMLDYIGSYSRQLEKIINLTDGYTKEADYIYIREVFEDAVAISIKLKQKKIDVANKLSGEKIFANKSLLTHLFYNFIDNSLKYGGEKLSLIILSLEKEKDFICIIYSDDGMGVFTEEKGKIFEKGFGAGTGQGLYLIKRICDIHNWEVEEAGEYGKGAKFKIKIPQYHEETKENYKI